MALELSSFAIQLCVLVVVVLIIALFSMMTVFRLDADHRREIENANTRLIHEPDEMRFVFERYNAVDCTRTRIPCVVDRQCLDNCQSQNMTGNLVCYEGFCAARDANVSGRPDDFECDAKIGLLTAFVASEYIVTQLCVSTYRDVIDDLGEPRPYLCGGGTLDINLLERQFAPSDCRCASGYRRMLFHQTAWARSIPVCIPNRSYNVYNKIYQEV
jgi:Per os infectivity factor 3